MKKGWILILLISLGLNLGLGLRLYRASVRDGGRDDGPRGRGPLNGAGWQRPAAGDSTTWRRFMGRRIGHLTARLDLDEDQRAHFEAVQAASGRLMHQERVQMQHLRQQLREMMQSAAIDGEAVRRAMAAIARAQTRSDSLVAETLLREMEVLRPDQRVRYLDFLPDGQGRHKGGGRRGRGGPGGG